MTLPAVAPSAPPNLLAPDELRLRPSADGRIDVDPSRAGWRYLSFETRRLQPGRPLSVDIRGLETVLVLVAGGPLRVRAGSDSWELPARPSPFEALPWAVYVPVDTPAAIDVSGPAGADVALARAPVSGRGGVAADPVVISATDVAVEVRGAGNATRQVNHIVTPDFPADRLLLVEVLTPSGNWSSWPPHKHDVDDMPAEAVLEEVYHYRFRRPEAWGIQRLYRRPERGLPARDAMWAVRDGEVVLVPDGYHPFVAAQGDDAWYLNALAGDRRTMACSFDPDLDHVRGDWAQMAADPRVPLVRR